MHHNVTFFMPWLEIRPHEGYQRPWRLIVVHGEPIIICVIKQLALKRFLLLLQISADAADISLCRGSQNSTGEKKTYCTILCSYQPNWIIFASAGCLINKWLWTQFLIQNLCPKAALNCHENLEERSLTLQRSTLKRFFRYLFKTSKPFLPPLPSTASPAPVVGPNIADIVYAITDVTVTTVIVSP